MPAGRQTASCRTWWQTARTSPTTLPVAQVSLARARLVCSVPAAAGADWATWAGAHKSRRVQVVHRHSRARARVRDACCICRRPPADPRGGFLPWARERHAHVLFGSPPCHVLTFAGHTVGGLLSYTGVARARGRWLGRKRDTRRRTKRPHAGTPQEDAVGEKTTHVARSLAGNLQRRL